jgi:hypothetical protein
MENMISSFGIGFLIKSYTLMFLHFRYKFVITQTHPYEANYIPSIVLHGMVIINYRRRNSLNVHHMVVDFKVIHKLCHAKFVIRNLLFRQFIKFD